MPKTPRKRPSSAPPSLRQRAEAALAHRRQDLADMPVHDLHRLVHELEIHQIELSMQNEDLRHTQLELAVTRDRYADLYDFAPMGYLSLDADGAILETNLTATQLLGVARSRLLRRRFTDFVAHDSETQDAVYLHRQQVFAEATTHTCNLWMQRQDGTPFYAQLKSLARQEEAGGQLCWRLALIDLTALRQQAEAQLAWTAAIVDSSRDAIIGTAVDNAIVSWNTAAERLYGYRATEAVGRSIALLAPSERRQEQANLLAQIQHGERLEHYETQHLTKDGSRIEVSLALSPIHRRDGSLIGVSVIARNVTAHKRREAQLRATEQALRQSQTQLRRLAQHQQQLQEQERASMAREIHDELAQALTSLHLDIAWLSGRDGTTPEALDRLRAMAAQVDTLDQAVHRIAMALHPRLLDDLGLLAAIDWYLHEVCQHTDLRCTLQVPAAELRLAPNQTAALFRVFQEALTNVVRHANASHVEVRVTQSRQAVRLVVADNGSGITPVQRSDPQALGLLGMRERAKLWGGAVTITGHPGRGTIVTVRLPYRATAEDEVSA